jgi:trans-aconitate methyltransferase
MRLKKRYLLLAALCLLLGVGIPYAAVQYEVPLMRLVKFWEPKLDVPYVPTPQRVVDEMLKMAAVKEGDVVYDLGCGDGRIVVTAAQKFGATGMGVDIDPKRIQESNANAEKAGVTDKVKFERGDLFKMDLAPATVVTMYLLPNINLKLRPKLFSELKPGTRIVSHAFDMGEWKPEKTVKVRVDSSDYTLYYWTIPAKEDQPTFKDTEVKQATGTAG